ncbi:MAG: transporter [Gemmataceae bacterium]|nr:transporter [Gemmataceae bacterium]
MSRLGKLVRTAAVAALTTVGAAPAFAQVPAAVPADVANAPLPDINDVLDGDTVLPTGHFGKGTKSNCGPVPYCPPGQAVPYTPVPGTVVNPNPGVPMTVNPNTGMPMTGMGAPPAVSDDASAFAGGRGRGAGSGPYSSQGGYIDNALPITHFRLRYDSAYGNNRPDRAEFFYPKCGCFQGLGQTDAKGPPNPNGETNVDYQEVTPYFEYAPTQRLSAFVGIPVRFINPTLNNNASGLGDVYFGAKYAVVYNPNRVVTLQLRVITPTGNGRQGLGTENWWVEPGLLHLEQLTERWQAFGQFKAQIAVDPQSNFTGNVLTYGLGSSYIVAQGCWGYVAPVVEFVGWTVTSGRELTQQGEQSATGATIVNGKVGVRIGFGQPGPFNISKSDLYVGYGRALTGEVWYKDMFRVEYRRFF